MKRALIFAVVIGMLLSCAAFAQEQNPDQSNFVGNLAARYYPAKTDFGNGFNYNISNIWLEGNVFVGCKCEWKGSVEWYGGSKTNNFCIANTLTPVKLTQNQVIGRIGYDVWDGTYITADYKWHKNTFGVAGIGTGSDQFKGFGLGIDKVWQVSKQWDIHTNVHYYPTLSGTNKYDFHDIEYEAGLVYRIPSAVNIDAGFRGEQMKGFNNASGTTVNINGPYLGISKDF